MSTKINFELINFGSTCIFIFITKETQGIIIKIAGVSSLEVFISIKI